MSASRRVLGVSSSGSRPSFLRVAARSVRGLLPPVMVVALVVALAAPPQLPAAAPAGGSSSESAGDGGGLWGRLAAWLGADGEGARSARGAKVELAASSTGSRSPVLASTSVDSQVSRAVSAPTRSAS
jgi:hypothetical protein